MIPTLVLLLYVFLCVDTALFPVPIAIVHSDIQSPFSTETQRNKQLPKWIFLQVVYVITGDALMEYCVLSIYQAALRWHQSCAAKCIHILYPTA